MVNSFSWFDISVRYDFAVSYLFSTWILISDISPNSTTIDSVLVCKSFNVVFSFFTLSISENFSASCFNFSISSLDNFELDEIVIFATFCVPRSFAEH